MVRRPLKRGVGVAGCREIGIGAGAGPARNDKVDELAIHGLSRAAQRLYADRPPLLRRLELGVCLSLHPGFCRRFTLGEADRFANRPQPPLRGTTRDIPSRIQELYVLLKPRQNDFLNLRLDAVFELP